MWNKLLKILTAALAILSSVLLFWKKKDNKKQKEYKDNVSNTREKVKDIVRDGKDVLENIEDAKKLQEQLESEHNEILTEKTQNNSPTANKVVDDFEKKYRSK